MNHAGADEAQVDILGALVVGELSDDVVSVALRDVVVVNIRVGDHRLVDDI
jgi:hypothetical protein